MTGGNKNIKQFNASDIRRYLEGKLLPAEMHQIEKAALEDPFLADAIEGMQRSGNFDNEVADLKKRISGNKMPQKIWWRVAAVLVTIITGIAIIFITAQKQVTAPAVLSQKQEKKEDRGQRTEGKPETADVKRETGIVKEETANGKRETAKVRQQAAGVEEEITSYKKVDQKKVSPKPDPGTDAQQDQEARSFKENNAPQASAVSKMEIKTDSIAADMAISGKKDTQERNKSALGRQGNDTTLSEVVVVGFGATPNHPVPAGGWKSFDEYINKNRRINNEDSLLTGTEEISFDIDEQGKPIGFDIIKSLSETHDRESIRLLEEGPRWEVGKQNKRRFRLQIRF